MNIQNFKKKIYNTSFSILEDAAFTIKRLLISPQNLFMNQKAISLFLTFKNLTKK